MKGISVVIPAYNRERFILQAVNSVLSQQVDRDIEILVSDDGSNDRTVHLVESLGKNVKVLRKPKDCLSQGASGARNRGIQAATMPYICFLDSDDFYLPGHLQAMVNCIESKPDLGFAFCRILEMNEDKYGDRFRLWTKSRITQQDVSHLIVSKHNVIQTNGFIFQRSVFEKVGLFREDLKNSEDIDMWMRISERYSGAFSDHYGAVIRRHGMDQLTDTPMERLLEGHITIFRAAIDRLQQQPYRSRYRLFKLNYMLLKYKIFKIGFLYEIYGKIHKIKADKNSMSRDWQLLSHFV